MCRMESAIEAEYVRAIKERDAATDPLRQAHFQGAVESVEEIMVQSWHLWAWDVCVRRRLVPDNAIRSYLGAMHEDALKINRDMRPRKK